MATFETIDTGARMGTRVKVCGVTDPAEITGLESSGVDFAGLWFGVPGGPADLPLDVWRALVAETETVSPVLVTFLKSADELGEALAGSGVEWIQLHGYQSPGLIRKLKRRDPGLKVMKVLHVRDGECLEESLIGAYEDAGTDIFLFDPVSAEGQVGSTGQTLDPSLVLSLADKLERPFLLAGGLSAANASEYEAVTSHPRFYGVDVDTNARGPDGKLSGERVAAIVSAWQGPERVNGDA